MDTLWVPVARQVPIRAKENKEEKWLLPGGEAGGAFLRELPQKLEQSREKTWERGSGVCLRSVAEFGHRPGASKLTHKWLQPGSQQGQASAPTKSVSVFQGKSETPRNAGFPD